MKRVYMDYNATTPLLDEVKKLYGDLLDNYANASSMHEDGRIAKKRIEEARCILSKFIGAKSNDEVIFTSGGSESDAMVFNTMLFEKENRNRNLIVISAIEHPAVIESAKRLKELGFDICVLEVDEYGFVKKEAFEKALLKKPLLVSIMSANNEIGTVQDIEYFCNESHAAGALFHTDAVQALGKIPFDVSCLDVDYAAFSSHKIYGPKGVGALYVKKGSPIKALICGGEQEKGLRAGTYNLPSIIAFGEAARNALDSCAETSYKEIRNLLVMLRDGLISQIPSITINGAIGNDTLDSCWSLPNTLDVSFPGAEGESILLHLDLLGISVSTGSACASANLESSHVLGAIGLGPEVAHSSIRFSLGKYTTKEDIEYIIKELPPVIKKLRAMSTVRY